MVETDTLEMDEQRERRAAVLLLDGCGSVAAADRGTADSSLSGHENRALKALSGPVRTVG
jgi:hypothetical protein